MRSAECAATRAASIMYNGNSYHEDGGGRELGSEASRQTTRCVCSYLVLKLKSFSVTPADTSTGFCFKSRSTESLLGLEAMGWKE